MSDVRIYYKVFTESEVRALHTAEAYKCPFGCSYC